MVSKAEKRARAQAKLAAANSTKTGETQAPSTPAATTQAPATEKPKVVSKVVGNLKVKMEGVSLRGAREAWYTKLKEFDGKPAQDYLDACNENHPSLPKSGRAENPSGWLRWFVRNQIATIVQPAQK